MCVRYTVPAFTSISLQYHFTQLKLREREREYMCFVNESECEWITNGVIGGFVVTPCAKTIAIICA